MEYYILLAIIFIGPVLFLIIQNKVANRNFDKAMDARTKVKEYLSYDSETKTLTLEKRDYLIAKVIDCKKVYITDISYKPEELHFGSATVGGITTGGTYKTGGYYQETGKHNTGLCELVYKDSPLDKNGKRINTIQLGDSLYNEAIQNRYISEYVDEETHQIHVVEEPNITEHQAMSAIHDIMYAQRLQCKGLPSSGKAEAIYDWITLSE